MTVGCLRRVSLLADSQAERVRVAVGGSDVDDAISDRRRGAEATELGGEGPDLLPGGGVRRVDVAVVRNEVDHPVNNARRVGYVVPGGEGPALRAGGGVQGVETVVVGAHV